MTDSYFPYRFEARVTLHRIGEHRRVLSYHVVFLPDDLESQLPFARFPRLRVEAEIAEQPARGASSEERRVGDDCRNRR